jgi:hypothetical protein
MAEPFRIGSAAHKQLFCRVFIASHDRYEPAAIAWPGLAPEARQRLVALRIWDLAIATESSAARRMERFAAAAADPLVRAAVALNAFEERRHEEVLGDLVRFYGIALRPESEARRSEEPLQAFLRTGYGELMDSFFAFGLFALAKRSGFFPAELVAAFEPVIQEEARHNLFFVNWLAWERRRRGPLGQIPFLLRCAAALALQAWSRIGAAKAVDGANFTRKGGAAIAIGLEPRGFLALCLAEHERRLAPYDARLLRPRLMPGLARLALALLGRPRAAVAQGREASL